MLCGTGDAHDLHIDFKFNDGKATCSGSLNALPTKEALRLITGEELALNLGMETLFAQKEFLTEQRTSRVKRKTKILNVGGWYF